MHTSSQNQPTRQDGQAIVEYMLLLALVGTVLIGIVTLAGVAVRNVFENQITLLDPIPACSAKPARTSRLTWNRVSVPPRSPRHTTRS